MACTVSLWSDVAPWPHLEARESGRCALVVDGEGARTRSWKGSQLPGSAFGDEDMEGRRKISKEMPPGSPERGGSGLPGHLKARKYSNYSDTTGTRVMSPPKQGISAWALLTFGPDDSSWLGRPGHVVCAASPGLHQLDAKASF